MFYRVKNHERFQHYRERNPPWIKWHFVNAISDYGFSNLEDHAKWHAVGLASLASQLDNHIPADAEWVGRMIHASQPIDFKPLEAIGFIVPCDCDSCREQDASKTLARRKQSAMPSRGEESREEKNYICAADRISDTDVREVFERHLVARTRYFERKNGKKPASLPDLTPELRIKIREAIRRHGKKKAIAAGVGIFYSDFHTGKNDEDREYLSPHLCWRIQTGKTHDRNNVEQFAELALEKHSQFGLDAGE